MKNAIYKRTQTIPIDMKNMLTFIPGIELLEGVVVVMEATLLELQFCFCWHAVFIITIEFKPITAPRVRMQPIICIFSTIIINALF